MDELKSIHAHVSELNKDSHEENTDALNTHEAHDCLIPNLDRLKRIAMLDGNVIVTGASGTGKSMCAKAIHAHSNRSNGPLVIKGCGGITDDLFNEELNGHVKGAFTGASSARAGLVEQANNGTLVLDDFDCLSKSSQQALLHIIENKVVTRIGDEVSHQHPADVRYIVTTNDSPEEMMEKGTLRRDFFHRLARWRFHVPALNERPKDIEQAIAHYSSSINDQFQVDSAQRTLSDDVVRLLSHLYWVGNFRQLREVVENLLVFAKANSKGVIGLSQANKVIFDEITFPRNRELVQFANINKPSSVGLLLRLLQGNKVLAAQLMDCSRTTLYDVIRKHNLE